MGSRKNLPFAIFVHMCVRLNWILFNQKFNALIKWSGHRWWLLAKQNFDRIIRCQAHYVLSAYGMWATLAVRTIGHAIYANVRNRIKNRILNHYTTTPDDTEESVMQSQCRDILIIDFYVGSICTQLTISFNCRCISTAHVIYWSQRNDTSSTRYFWSSISGKW